MICGNLKIFILMLIFLKNDVLLKCLVLRIIFVFYFRLMFDEVCFNLIVVEGICFFVFILKFNFVDNCL